MFYSNQNNQYYLISKIFINRKENKLTVSREKIKYLLAVREFTIIVTPLFRYCCSMWCNYRISAFCSNDMECSLV